jgi:hypothetical protein
MFRASNPRRTQSGFGTKEFQGRRAMGGNDKERVCDVSEKRPDPALSMIARQKPMIDQGKLKQRMDRLARAIGRKTERACE